MRASCCEGTRGPGAGRRRWRRGRRCSSPSGGRRGASGCPRRRAGAAPPRPRRAGDTSATVTQSIRSPGRRPASATGGPLAERELVLRAGLLDLSRAGSLADRAVAHAVRGDRRTRGRGPTRSRAACRQASAERGGSGGGAADARGGGSLGHPRSCPASLDARRRSSATHPGQGSLGRGEGYSRSPPASAIGPAAWRRLSGGASRSAGRRRPAIGRGSRSAGRRPSGRRRRGARARRQ